jgi:transposase
VPELFGVEHGTEDDDTPKVIQRSLDEHVRWLEKRLADFDDALSSLIGQTPIWRERDLLLRSVPGMGPVLSSTVLAHLPEPGTLNPTDRRTGRGHAL